MDELCYRLLDKDTKMMGGEQALNEKTRCLNHAWLINTVLFPEIACLPPFKEQVSSTCAVTILYGSPSIRPGSDSALVSQGLPRLTGNATPQSISK